MTLSLFTGIMSGFLLGVSVTLAAIAAVVWIADRGER